MTPEELSRIRGIYEQALPMSSAAREDFVRRECQDKGSIRAEVERLLIPTTVSWTGLIGLSWARPETSPLSIVRRLRALALGWR